MEITFIDCDVNIFEAEQAPIIEGGEEFECELCEAEEADITIVLPEGLELTPELEEAMDSLTDDFLDRLYEVYEAHGWVAPDECECEEFCDCRGAEGTE